MIELVITKTSKSCDPKAHWYSYDYDRLPFVNLNAAREWLVDTYGGSKRRSMYIDLKNGGSKRIGYIIGFKNYDYENGKKIHFLEQHWIEFRSCRSIDPVKGE